jgi:hypothetical protein
MQQRLAIGSRLDCHQRRHFELSKSRRLNWETGSGVAKTRRGAPPLDFQTRENPSPAPDQPVLQDSCQEPRSPNPAPPLHPPPVSQKTSPMNTALYPEAIRILIPKNSSPKFADLYRRNAHNEFMPIDSIIRRLCQTVQSVTGMSRFVPPPAFYPTPPTHPAAPY